MSWLNTRVKKEDKPIGYAGSDGCETVPAFDCHPDCCPVALLDAQSGESVSRVGVSRSSAGPGDGWGMTKTGAEYADAGGASRFFYCAKASSAERTLPDGRRSAHPTMKPLGLMQWLVRLACSPGGVLLDPFLGSGTTLVACDREGVEGIGIECDPGYAADAEARVRGDAPLFAGVVRIEREGAPLFAATAVEAPEAEQGVLW
jgi:DNA methylase